MRVAPTATRELDALPTALRAHQSAAPPGRPLARCPRPACGGRLLLVALDLTETAAICMLCARTQPSAFAFDKEASYDQAAS